MTKRRRLDAELVAQGFFPTAGEAARAVMAGDVSTSDRRLDHPGEQVRPGVALHVRGHLPYVGRGGLKLERGLSAFGVDPEGLACLDVGCSTGGFTDCLLKHGAARVVAVDVGQAQFDWSLRNDPRVDLHERTNIVDLPGTCLDATIDLAVCDVSFTSVTTVLPAVLALLKRDGCFLTLVKPQFEAPRTDVGEGGVVRDAAVQLASLEKVAAAFLRGGLRVRDACESPVRGHKGNREFLLLGEREPDAGIHRKRASSARNEAPDAAKEVPGSRGASFESQGDDVLACSEGNAPDPQMAAGDHALLEEAGIELSLVVREGRTMRWPA